jgi:outer membrane protein insertion porin family
MKKIIMKYLKLFIFVFLSVIFSNNGFSDIINKITISGNSRITDETIITFLPVKLNTDIDEIQINNITKELYETNFFKNITITFNNNDLNIIVEENPIIQNIIFNGIKSNSLKQFITSETILKSRSSFTESFLEQDLNKIKDKLNVRGYYFSSIMTKIETLDDNIINLIYDFNLGEKAKIKKISFIGDKVYKDKKLKSIILSEEYKFWKFISGKKFLNEELVAFDKRLLLNFFKNQGFYNIKVSSSFAKLVDNNYFELIFNIDSGEKIYFGDLSLNLPINYNKENFLKLSQTLDKLKNEPYSINSIEKITEQIDLLALYEQYETIDVEVIENLIKNKLNITFNIKETEKTFIKRVDLFGNNVTRENVIRNQFEIDEGDFYNKILFNKTLNNLNSLNFFKSVEGEVVSDDETGDKILEIFIEEKPTGEIGASAGVGTSGNSVGVFVRENNYLGTGISLGSDLTLSTESIRGSLSLNNPNFNDTNKAVYSSIEVTEIDKLKDFGYKTNRSGFSYGTNFEFLDDFRFGIGNKNYYQKIETDSTASLLQRKQEGSYWDSFLSLDFVYDKRNQRFKTTDGFRSSYDIELPVISDTNTLTNTFNYQFYTELFDDNITTISFFAKTSDSISNDDIKLSERNFLPSSKLRGFQAGKVGPKDGNDYIGGNYASSINFSSTLPQILESNQNIDFLLFLDLGNVWGVDYDKSISDSNKVRSSAGVGVDWFTPIGPLNFSLSQPISKASTDSSETFRFNLGTTF